MVSGRHRFHLISTWQTVGGWRAIILKRFPSLKDGESLLFVAHDLSGKERSCDFAWINHRADGTAYNPGNRNYDLRRPWAVSYFDRLWGGRDP